MLDKCIQKWQQLLRSEGSIIAHVYSVVTQAALCVTIYYSELILEYLCICNYCVATHTMPCQWPQSSFDHISLCTHFVNTCQLNMDQTED